MDRFKVERFAVELWWCDLAIALKFPGKDVGEIVVVAQSLAFGRLMFFAEMRAAGFVTSKGVETHELGEFQKVGHATRAFE